MMTLDMDGLRLTLSQSLHAGNWSEL
ncbi:MAG: hypothetical protein ACD_62C00322G0001, partial [uncultured bacterium]